MAGRIQARLDMAGLACSGVVGCGELRQAWSGAGLSNKGDS